MSRPPIPGRRRRGAAGARWAPPAIVLVVALAGAAGSLAVGAASGMHRSALAHLAALLIPAAVVTVVALAATGPLLVRAGVRNRLLAVSLIGTLTSVANLVVLAVLMFVQGDDVVSLAVLVVYSAAAGAGAAFVAGRSTTAAVERIGSTARAIAEGDLAARVGPLEAERELVSLGADLDQMAGRLQEAVDRVREVESRRRDLVVAVSHDLRTPLASLRAMVEAVDDGVVEDVPTLRRYAGEMRRSVGTLSALVDDLFELVQLDAGAIERETHRARVEDVVHAALEACRAGAEAKRLAVTTDVDGAAGAECSPRLVRVLQNLLVNAIRHTPPDGTIVIEAERRPGSLLLAVADTGEGVPEEVRDRIWEPFWRGDPARAEPGAGLGLTLSKRIVEALGGTIEATDREPGGTRFAVTLPAA